MFYNRKKKEEVFIPKPRKTSLSARDKLDIATNLKSGGFSMDGSTGMLEDEVAKVTAFGQKVLDSDNNSLRGDSRKEFKEKAYLDTLRGLPEREIMERMVVEAPYNEDTADDFAEKFNDMGLMRYKAKPVKNNQGKVEWSWSKGVDRYEANKDPRTGQPIYSRIYTDNTSEQIDPRTFEEEKYYNFLPKDIKDKVLKKVK